VPPLQCVNPPDSARIVTEGAHRGLTAVSQEQKVWAFHKARASANTLPAAARKLAGSCGSDILTGLQPSLLHLDFKGGFHDSTPTCECAASEFLGKIYRSRLRLLIWANQAINPHWSYFARRLYQFCSRAPRGSGAIRDRFWRVCRPLVPNDTLPSWPNTRQSVDTAVGESSQLRQLPKTHF